MSLLSLLAQPRIMTNVLLLDGTLPVIVRGVHSLCSGVRGVHSLLSSMNRVHSRRSGVRGVHSLRSSMNRVHSLLSGVRLEEYAAA